MNNYVKLALPCTVKYFIENVANNYSFQHVEGSTYGGCYDILADLYGQEVDSPRYETPDESIIAYDCGSVTMVFTTREDESQEWLANTTLATIDVCLAGNSRSFYVPAYVFYPYIEGSRMCEYKTELAFEAEDGLLYKGFDSNTDEVYYSMLGTKISYEEFKERACNLIGTLEKVTYDCLSAEVFDKSLVYITRFTSQVIEGLRDNLLSFK